MSSFSKYLNLLLAEKKKFPNAGTWGLLKYYKRWSQSFTNNQSIQEIPWMTFGVVNFLESYARKDMKVFEYGSGSSTLFWAKRVGEIVSIEHDPEWAQHVKHALAQFNYRHVKLELVEPEKTTGKLTPADPFQFGSDDEKFKGYSFEKYVLKIREYPDDHFDVVVVDGRARPSCIAAGIAKVKPGGILLVDNSEREYYFAETLSMLSSGNWIRQDYCGPVPGLRHFHQTTVFKKIQ